MERRKAGEREDQKYQRAGDDAGEVWRESGGTEVETGKDEDGAVLIGIGHRVTETQRGQGQSRMIGGKIK